VKQFTVFILVLSLSSSAFAHTWWVGSVSTRWDNPANWNGGLPVGDGSGAAALVAPGVINTTILIDSATAAVANRFYVGDAVGDSTLYTVNMTGGTLTCTTGSAQIFIGNWGISQAEFNLSGGIVTTSDISLGNDPAGDAGPSGWLTMDDGEVNYDHLFSLATWPGAYGELNMNGGKITYTGAVWAAAGMLVGDAGDAVLNMTGGEIDLGVGTLYCPWDTDAQPEIHLDGGIIRASNLFMTGRNADRSPGSLDITNGTLILNGLWTASHPWVVAGYITAYGGAGSLIFNYDGVKTTITAGTPNPAKAREPNPGNGATGIALQQVLSWTAGDGALSHDVYFGTSFSQVSSATDPDILPGRGNQSETTYSPADFTDYSTTYYWRIDEVNASETVEGDVWSYSTTHAPIPQIPLRALTGSDSVVVFNEIMYHPATDEANLEWVEFYNQMAVDVDMSGWSVHNGIEYEFPEGTIIPGGGFLVLAISPTALEAATGYVGAYGPFAGRLSNAGEELQLVDKNGRIMNELEYDDEGDWPVAADGSGVSLAKIDPDSASNPAENWSWSEQMGGTPGAHNFSYSSGPDTEVVLVETGAEVWALAPTDNSLGTTWRDLTFNHTGWLSGTTGVGYEASSGDYGDYFNLDVKDEMYDDGSNPTPNATCYIRIPFTVADPTLYTSMTLRMMYDDGFAAFLNGQEVEQANAPGRDGNPGTLTWDSQASTDHPDAQAKIFQDFDLTNYLGALETGDNVLAIHGLNMLPDSTDFLILPELHALTSFDENQNQLALNEISSATAAPDNFWVELVNYSNQTIELTGMVLHCQGVVTDDFVFPVETIDPNHYRVIYESELGFCPTDEDKLFLYNSDVNSVIDAAVVKNSPRGRYPEATGKWLYPDVGTPGSENSFNFHDEIVINEIMYHPRPEHEPYKESPEAWVELYNRSGRTIDLTGWTLRGGIEYNFPYGSSLGPGEYLVITDDADFLATLYPGINILGNFSRDLSYKDDLIILKDANRNPADEVHYYESGRWPKYADGGGSSLELRDPDADNSSPEAWDASEESGKSSWQTYSYRGIASASVGNDNQWHEFVLGLLKSGEILLDDIQVVEDPDGTAIEFLQNGTFESDTLGSEPEKWRIIGNHYSEVIVDPDDPGNQVLWLVARGATEHMHNHAETTFGGGKSVVNGREYEISFRAKWVAGSNQLHTRLYFNRLARRTIIEVPPLSGTPGARNSRYEANIGPTYREFGHHPAVPKNNEPVTVSVVAEDPNGVSLCTLWWAIDGGIWNSEAMNHQGSGLYTAAIPGQSSGTIVQFYVAGQDGLAATSTYPAAGPDSRALYKVEDGQADSGGLHNFRIIMTTADTNWLHELTNVMSNDRLGATVVYNEKEVYYDVGVRLKGGERARNVDIWLGFSVKFKPDHLFRGIHEKVVIDRSDYGCAEQGEILAKHLSMHAGGIFWSYDDLAHVIAPRSQHTGPAIMQLARNEDVFLDSQFANGSNGWLFEYELIYYPTTTIDGNPESLKVPEPDTVIDVDIQNLGDDKEPYRWIFQTKNKRIRDDYSRLIDMAKTFSLSGETLEEKAAEVMDVDNWMRTFAMQTLLGVSDTYTRGHDHNLRIYLRPEDQKAVVFPWDWDGLCKQSTSASLWGNRNLSKIIARAPYRRLIYGHFLDIINTTFNYDYITPWASHFASLTGDQSYSGCRDYFVARANYVSSQLPTLRGIFEITDPNSTVDTDYVVIHGEASIDVKEVYLEGSEDPLELSWTYTGYGPSERYYWQATAPLAPGINPLKLLAYDFRGNLIGSDEITIISTLTERPLQDYLCITEIMYDPVGGSDYEFVELCNTGPQTLDLTDVVVRDAINDFAFKYSSVTSLAPGEYVVIVRDIPAFEFRYGTNVLVAGEYTGKLANEGEQLRLTSKWNAEVLTFEYADNRGWPLAADGAGHSLVPLPLALTDQNNGSLDYGGNWRASTYIHGSPGQADPPPPTSIVLNEFMAHTDLNNPAYPDHDSNDWIELYNPTDSAITLTADSWYLSDDKDDLQKWAIPAMVIPTHSWVSFDEITGFHQDPLGGTGFGLNKTGEEVLLSYLPGTAEDRVVDCLRFKGQETSVSLGRYPDGHEYWYPMSPSRDGENSEPPTHIVFSEIMYYPLTNQHQYIELFNPTAQPVVLENAQGPWRIEGLADYTLPSGISIPSDGRLILVSFNPYVVVERQAFESEYGTGSLIPGVDIVGPWPGNLSYNGERLALERSQAPDELGDPVSWVIVDETIYFRDLPWPVAANGAGRVLQRIRSNISGNNPQNWVAANATPGEVASLPADFNVSGTINLVDFSVFSAAWLSREGDSNWNVLCDISNPPDDVIDLRDLSELLNLWLWQASNSP